MRSNYNKLFIKYGDKINKDYMNNVIDRYEKICDMLFEDRNKLEVLDSFFYNDVVKEDLIKKVNSIKEDIDLIDKKKNDLMDYCVNKLRYEGNLKKVLMNLSNNELSYLNSIVSLGKDFNEVDKMKFEEVKRNRGEIKNSLTSNY